MHHKYWHLLILFWLLPVILPVTVLSGCGCSKTAGTSVLSACSGDVQVKIADAVEWVQAKVKAILTVKDAIKTGVDSSALITFFDGSVIELKPNTQIEINELIQGKSKSIKLKQEIGETLSKVEKLMDSASRYEIETPVAVAAVRGSQMVVQVVADGTTSVGNVEGSISVTAQGKEVIIPEGKHSIVVPGATPSQPSEGTTSRIISTQIYTDPDGDLFNNQSMLITGPDYIDIQTSQIYFTDGKWILKMGLKKTLPSAASVTAKTLVEWNFLLDFDRNKATGLNRPFISNDIGYDFLVQLSLENNVYSCHLLDLVKDKSETIDYITNEKNIEIQIPLTSFGITDVNTLPAIDWGTCAIYYKDEDPRNQPSFTDKAPNDGHYAFTQNQSSYSAFDDFSNKNGNPNGVWSYGWMPKDFSVFNHYALNADSVFKKYAPRDLISWYAELGSDRTPCIWINTGDTAYGAPNHWLSLHPGPREEPSVIRWTAPVTGNIQVMGEFLPGDSGKMTVAIRHKNRELWTATDSGKFNLPVEVLVGDTLDFAVYGGYWSGNTPLSANITYIR